MPGLLRAQDLEAAVARAVVDGDELVRPRRARQRLGDLVEEDGDVLFLVVDREDDGEVHLSRECNREGALEI